MVFSRNYRQAWITRAGLIPDWSRSLTGTETFLVTSDWVLISFFDLCWEQIFYFIKTIPTRCPVWLNVIMRVKSEIKIYIYVIPLILWWVVFILIQVGLIPVSSPHSLDYKWTNINCVCLDWTKLPFVTCCGETGNKLHGRCFSFFVHYCMTNIGPTLSIK